MTRRKDVKKAVLLAVIGVCASKINRKKKLRSELTKELLKRQLTISSFSEIHNELKAKEESSFPNDLCLSRNLFQHLLEKVTPHIEKQDTTFRDSISPSARLEATLRFLANGSSYKQLQSDTGISQPSLTYIIPEACDAIYRVLKDKYLKVPENANEWKKVSDEYEKKWNFPHCLGAIDGKHVVFRSPQSGSSSYYNYKGSYCVILMACVDANYKFLCVDIDTSARAGHSTLWENFSLNKNIYEGKLKLPEDEALPGTNRILPYVFIGDAALPLKRNLLKPYPREEQSDSQRIFSCRLSGAHKTAENAFAILSNRFNILLKPVNLGPEKVVKVVRACIVLHNFLLTETAPEVSTTENVIADERNRQLLPLDARDCQASEEAEIIRTQFCDYFNNEGSVPWQHNMAGLE